ncbi:hypothetical protein [Natronosalvus halobius]|uniref:hypothetical protein n=1 Tax=Natronosalvus halobius TaxID=2953746 RepID=UPI0020A0BA68|nr:hypothetical protein [Natronosalvus halobius]USZ71097.1 hypothetical protein NGM15_13525 [Natronosalvus halobius]
MYWAFIMPSRVETCEAQANEMVARCETLFETFEDFIVPTEINYAIGRFPPGQRLLVGVSMNEYLETIERELRNESGITVEAFRDSTHVDESGSRWIPRVAFDGTEVKVRLNDGDVAASRRSNTVEYRKDEPLNNDPTQDPLELSVLHGSNTDNYDTDAGYVTSIIVAPMSDIWFEESDIGTMNRRHLTAFLERIENTFPVVDVERTSEWLPLTALEAVY